MTDANRRKTIRQQAERLGFQIDETVVDDVLSTTEELQATAGQIQSENSVRQMDSVEPSGEYDEFLATYQTPRQEEADGLLAGLTVAVKDNIAVDGLPMTCGSAALNMDPGTDATVVDRLLAEGACLVGKTNQDAFAFGPSGEFSDRGTVKNPPHENRVPGGSSSGSGAAVAAKTVDLALGSDTGGSVRIPAACCGIVGIKPTYGIVPRHGFLSFAPSLDTIGPLARDLDTAATALATLIGKATRDPSIHSTTPVDSSDPVGAADDVAVGMPTQFFDRSSDTVSKAIQSAVDVSAVRAQDVDLALEAVEEAYLLIGSTEFAWYLDQCGTIRGEGADYSGAIYEMIASIRDEDLGEHIARRVLPAASLDSWTQGESYLSARQEVLRFQKRLDRVFDTVDALVLPTIWTVPPERGEIESVADMMTLLGNTAPFNLAGTPAVSVPVRDVGGLPVSAQVVTRAGADFEAVDIARLLIKG